MAIYGPTSLIAIVAQVDGDATRLISYLIYIPVLRIFEITNCKYQKCRIFSCYLMKIKRLHNLQFKFWAINVAVCESKSAIYHLSSQSTSWNFRSKNMHFGMMKSLHWANCGFKIFLPLRFYVKSVSGIVEVQKLPF